jgi:hypothetical protein
MTHQDHVVFDLDCPQCQSSEGFLEALRFMTAPGRYGCKNQRAKQLLAKLEAKQ